MAIIGKAIYVKKKDIIDLTNTTWYFNSIVTPPPSSGFDIFFTSEQNWWEETQFEYLYTNKSQGIFYRTTDGMYSSTPQYDMTTDTWTDEGFRTITITGGADTTSEWLVSWLKQNAILQIQ